MKIFHTKRERSPEAVTNAFRTIVWQAQNNAFNRTVTTDGITLNLGFPGQYYDAETGLWYNGFRDYDAQLGRYIESDPIGVKGGIDTYAYVNENPLGYVDPFGLAWQASLGFGLNGAFIFFGGGGSVNVGFTSSGRLFFQAEYHGELGLGGYLGAGIQGGINHTKCDSAPGWSQSTTGIVEGDAGYGPSVGGSATFNGHGEGASTGVGKFGIGGGVWTGTGASHSYTYTTPTISQMWKSFKNWW